jgi:hypothetical protein
MAYEWLGRARDPLRAWMFRTLSAILATDDGRRLLADSLEGLTSPPPALPSPPLLADRPYPDIGATGAPHPVRSDPVFITGRFRSGSTLLWNIFRNVNGCTSYYEPLNERQWFDPRKRGERVDATHLGVEEYWKEYEGLEHLGRWYRTHWIDRNLYMSASHWDPSLVAYVQGLIDAAPGRAVLQFNRVDFRLPWLRHHFPSARLIHVYRHPRDQWSSSLFKDRFPREGTVAEFASHDHFYLLAWAKDLAYLFPFLDPRDAEHPYDLFYWIWKLSYLFGRQYADASFGLEAISASPERELTRLMAEARVEEYDLAALRALVVPQKSKWQDYADQDWFAQREARCDAILAKFLEAGSE